jgi:two-component system response regulator YesN
MLFAIQNIAEEYLGASTESLPIVFDNNKLIWLIQPKKENGGSAKMREVLWIRTIRFVQGMAEMIQQSCMELLKLKLSFAMANEARGWDKAAEQFDTLKLMLSCGLGLGQESILFDRNQIGEIFPRGYNHELRAELKRFESLAVFLENGQKQHFFNEYVRLTSLVNEAYAQVESLKLEIHVTLAAIFLSYINRWGLLVEIGDRHDLSKLGRFDRHLPWKQIADYYAQLAESLFDMKWNGQIYQENDVIKHIQWYVEQNLAGELSLTRIGEVVGHNPYYLSKLYKQITGEGLSDYIMFVRLKRAKELLTQNVLKINDISISVGFLSEQSFYRFFKKAAGITPQEYKNTRMEEDKRSPGAKIEN